MHVFLKGIDKLMKRLNKDNWFIVTKALQRQDKIFISDHVFVKK